MFLNRCISCLCSKTISVSGTLRSILDIWAIVSLILLQHHLHSGPMQEDQVRISLYAETRDRVAHFAWKYKRVTTQVYMFVEKLNHKPCFCFLVPTFPVSSLHWDPALTLLLGSLLAHSLSLNLHSQPAVRLAAPGNTPVSG